MFTKRIVGDRYDVAHWQLKSNNGVGWNARVHCECVMSQKLESH